jgi:hypothetical protein
VPEGRPGVSTALRTLAAAEPAGPVERGLVRVLDRLIRKTNPDGSAEGS